MATEPIAFYVTSTYSKGNTMNAMTQDIILAVLGGVCVAVLAVVVDAAIDAMFAPSKPKPKKPDREAQLAIIVDELKRMEGKR